MFVLKYENVSDADEKKTQPKPSSNFTCVYDNNNPRGQKSTVHVVSEHVSLVSSTSLKQRPREQLKLFRNDDASKNYICTLKIHSCISI